LTSYVLENGMGNYKLYLDSNETGTSFDRPGLLRLIDDIKRKLIHKVVVKDLSRLGRNNGETLTFLDFLKENQVQLISIGDNYDSFTDDDEIIGIRTWVNEHYSRDISKKVRANLKKKMKNGEHLSRPHFGYLKSDYEKNKLVVDERYRKVIQEIFDLYIKGWGYRALADYVQNRGIPTPSADKNYSGAKKAGRWNEQHIRRIITNRVYCGDTVQGVSEKISFKIKKTRRLPPEKWIVVENTHEAVVSREIFELAQQIRAKRWLEGTGRKKKREDHPHLFSGFLVCAACGSNLVYKKKKHGPARYICGRYNKYGRKSGGCTMHQVREDKLITCLAEDVECLAGETVFQNRLADEYRKKFKRSAGQITGEIKRLELKIAEKKRQQKTIYLDKIKGTISEELFLETNCAMEKEITVLKARIDRLTGELAGSAHIEEDMTKIYALKLQVDAADIDREFLEKYVRKIIVIEDGEGINREVREKYGLDLIFTGEQLAEIARKKVRLIILYDLFPVAQKTPAMKPVC